MLSGRLQAVRSQNGPISYKRSQSTIHMPGVNEALLDNMNKRTRGMDMRQGRPNPDTPQNVVSTTCVMLPPPMSHDDNPNPDSLYAPKSLNKLANVPTRGSWAVTVDGSTREGRDWLSSQVGSGANAYSNAIFGFTNMGGVPRHLRIRFAGLVGNAGQGHIEENSSRDNFGQVYSAGALTGSNTGPEFIPPLTPVYVSPYPYIRKDNKTGAVYPGFSNPGFPAGCDMYPVATHALRDTDVTAFFHHIDSKCDEAAKNVLGLTQGKIETLLRGLGVHEHVPVYKYAFHYAYQANAYARMEDYDREPIAAKLLAAITAINEVIVKNQEFWSQVYTDQRKMNESLGGPTGAASWSDNKEEYTALTLAPLKPDAEILEVSRMFFKLQKASMEIFKLQFAEQMNFMRALCFGVSRYGSCSEAQLDVLVGYRL